MKALVVLAALSVTAQPATVTITAVERAGIMAERTVSYMPDSDKYEYSGAIVRRGSRLVVLPAHTDRSVDSASMRPYEYMAPGDELVAVYHSHPCMPRTHYNALLSKPDVMISYMFAVPMFMLDQCSGDVHVYDPMRDHISDTAVEVHVRGPQCQPLVTYLPSGRIVGNIGRHTEDMDPPTLVPAVCVPDP